MSQPPAFTTRVRRVVTAIPAGVVLTYGEVAAEAGSPTAARAVGQVLAGAGDALPWWRVVTAAGRLVPGLEEEHAARLQTEGVACARGRVAAVHGGRSRRAPGAGSRDTSP